MNFKATYEAILELQAKLQGDLKHTYDFEFICDSKERVKALAATFTLQEYLEACMNEGKIDDTALPVEELGLSTRCYNALRYANVKTVGDLLLLDWLAFIRIRNLGKKSRQEIIDALENEGFNCDNLKESV